MTRTGLALAAGLVLTFAAAPFTAGVSAAQERSATDRLAQFFGRGTPPADFDEDDRPAPRLDSGASVRIDRLENQIRAMTGQIEQLQFTIRKLEENFRKLQQDTEFRLQEQATRPGKRAEDGAPPIVAQTTPAVTGTATPGDSARLRRGDAFDPTKEPHAPGAPRQIGTTIETPRAPMASAAPGRAANETGAPMDLSGGRLASHSGSPEPVRNVGPIVSTPLPSPAATAGPGAPTPLPPAAGTASLPTTPGGTVIASTEPFSPRDEYDRATSFLKTGQYEAAEKGYSTFLAKNPKNKLVPEAVFNLGESYFQRGRHREAAEQYLKISTTYSTTPRAPEAMLRLGQSLGALGAKEQACASFSEIPRKYPSASPTVRAAAEREAKKSQC